MAAPTETRAAKAYCALLIPVAILLGTWLAWKGFYYGRLLPNSFYAKLGWDVSVNINGLIFLGRFFHWYLLWPVVVLGLGAMLVRRSLPDRRLTVPLLIVGAWFAYIISIGGDFMEFRFLVPVSPMLFLVVAYLIVVPLGSLLVRKPIVTAVVLTVFLASMSFVHARTFKGRTRDEALDSIPNLATFVGVYPGGDWSVIGKRLRAELEGSDAILAMTGVGALPYYSGLRTIDMWGLNDRVVAEHGNPAPPSDLRPGTEGPPRFSI